MRQLLLCFTDCNIMNQMPALIENVMHDADIHIFQMSDKILGNDLCFLKKGIVNLAFGSEIVMPLDIA